MTATPGPIDPTRRASRAGGQLVLLAMSIPLAAVRRVQVNPKAGGLPGSQVLQDLVDGLAFWALLGCLAAIVIAAAVWAFAAHSNNHHYTANGRRGVLVAAAAALAIGASAAIVNFFAAAGGRVK